MEKELKIKALEAQVNELQQHNESLRSSYEAFVEQLTSQIKALESDKEALWNKFLQVLHITLESVK
jgi:hypothetical protein